MVFQLAQQLATAQQDLSLAQLNNGLLSETILIPHLDPSQTRIAHTLSQKPNHHHRELNLA